MSNEESEFLTHWIIQIKLYITLYWNVFPPLYNEIQHCFHHQSTLKILSRFLNQRKNEKWRNHLLMVRLALPISFVQTLNLISSPSSVSIMQNSGVSMPQMLPTIFHAHSAFQFLRNPTYLLEIPSTLPISSNPAIWNFCLLLLIHLLFQKITLQ